MQYSYFGNTSNRVDRLLYNFEMQLMLFDSLFKNADSKEVWENNSNLQMRYLELLKANKLIESKSSTKSLGTKDARVKSAPLENYHLINRKEKRLTKQGLGLLRLIENESYKIMNEFLQIDLISLFFIKASLWFSKDSIKDGLFERYLEVFRLNNGEISLQDFKYLPLIDNFTSTQEFIKNLGNIIIDYTYLESFTQDMESNRFNPFYFKTAKGEKSALEIIKTLQEIFLPLREAKISFEIALKNLNKSAFKKPYLVFLLHNAKSKNEKILALKNFIQGDTRTFAKRFFELIFTARIEANLDDYLDLNRRYLNLCGIFEFSSDRVALNPIFKLIIKHSKYNEILHIIKYEIITKNLLKEMINDAEFLTLCKNSLGITHINDLKNYQQTRDKKRLQQLLKTRFHKDNIVHILDLFEDRKNDEKIAQLVSTEATIPTIFEYIVAIAWCYIDECKIERILEAHLSLDSNLLPKSHAVGGSADFIYTYLNHSLMIEVTLTEKTNQRRAEMESVSRHLGNMLLKLDSHKRQESYAIFIAPYLDKNVLNDFRSRLYCYFENDENYIKGMNILPLSIRDLSKILHSNIPYKTLHKSFKNLLTSKNDWGSKWYFNEIKPFIDSLVTKANNV